MAKSQAHAVVVVPAPAMMAIDAPPIVSWLSRATVRRDDMPVLDLDRVLGALGLRAPTTGLAALRLWGQIGERPSAWVAAADPAFLEARLDDVHLHALTDEDVTAAELATLYDDLQARLFDGTGSSVARVGRCGYLRGDAMATASLPPSLLDGRRIDDYLPADTAAGLALSGEIQMSLHQHPLNSERAERGALPVNALWLWGGGTPPDPEGASLPPLSSDDPLFLGYWRNHGGELGDPDVGVPTAADGAGHGIVVTFPDEIDRQRLGEQFARLRELMRRGVLARLTVVRRDGVTAELRRGDRWRLWRSNAAGVFGVPA